MLSTLVLAGAFGRLMDGVTNLLYWGFIITIVGIIGYFLFCLAGNYWAKSWPFIEKHHHDHGSHGDHGGHHDNHKGSHSGHSHHHDHHNPKADLQADMRAAELIKEPWHKRAISHFKKKGKEKKAHH
jgi:hypothetical protein